MVKAITDATFEQETKNGLVLVDFCWALTAVKLKDNTMLKSIHNIFLIIVCDILEVNYLPAKVIFFSLATKKNC